MKRLDGETVGEKIIKVVVNIPDWLERSLAWPVLLYRRICYGFVFRRIPLTQGKYAIVDPDDYRHLCKYKWCAVRDGRQFYARRSFRTKEGRKRNMPMHRQVLKVAAGLLIDHINRDGLDNRKANLRPATAAQNARNRTKCVKENSVSKYKGVYRCVGRTGWQARMRVNGKHTFLGYFHDEVQAARAYDLAARKYHGQFAALNFPEAAARCGRRCAMVEALMQLLRLVFPRAGRIGGHLLDSPRCNT